MIDSFAISSDRVLIEEALIPATLIVENGIISEVIPDKKTPFAKDFGNQVIMPGLIDCHVHINEPGRTEWEGFRTATMAAAAGGITTLVDMPLNSTPVTTSKKAFAEKLQAAENKCFVNVGFWGGLIPESLHLLDELLASGVMGIKVFLTHSGIDDFPNITEKDLRRAMPILKKHDALILAHCELDAPNPGTRELDSNPRSYKAYLSSRPRSWEHEAIRMMIDLCRDYDVRTHIVHLSSADAIEMIDNARKEKLRLSTETCPQYLFFNAEDIPDGSTIHKCAPPIREKKNNQRLWTGLNQGVIEFIVSDHSPAPPSIKELSSGNFKRAWGGIAGLQFNLPVVWTMADKNGHSIPEVHTWLSRNIASFLGLETKKGIIKEGFDADLVVWSPEEEFLVTEDNIHFRHKISPYIGHRLKGRVRKTFLSGELVYDDGKFIAFPTGKTILKRSDA